MHLLRDAGAEDRAMTEQDTHRLPDVADEFEAALGSDRIDQIDRSDGGIDRGDGNDCRSVFRRVVDASWVIPRVLDRVTGAGKVKRAWSAARARGVRLWEFWRGQR